MSQPLLYMIEQQLDDDEKRKFMKRISFFRLHEHLCRHAGVYPE
jgi:hypothetical protein